LSELRELRIQFVDADWELTHQAAKIKTHHQMSCADCFAAALAKMKGANLVTGGEEFKPLEGYISITWVGVGKNFHYSKPNKS